MKDANIIRLVGRLGAIKIFTFHFPIVICMRPGSRHHSLMILVHHLGWFFLVPLPTCTFLLCATLITTVSKKYQQPLTAYQKYILITFFIELFFPFSKQNIRLSYWPSMSVDISWLFSFPRPIYLNLFRTVKSFTLQGRKTISLSGLLREKIIKMIPCLCKKKEGKTKRIKRWMVEEEQLEKKI